MVFPAELSGSAAEVRVYEGGAIEFSEWRFGGRRVVSVLGVQ